MDDDNQIDRFNAWEIVKAIAVVALIGVVAWKVIVTPVELVVDFSALLSLFLALFSVGLAALFYFKATDTSNTFYDNTYKFTKDIAQLLTKIESGFGERLRHLDEGYTSMREHIQKIPGERSVAEAKKKIEEEEQVIDKAEEERQALINQLLDRTQLQQEEKQKFVESLKAKEEQLEVAQKELSRMKRRIVVEKVARERDQSSLIGSPAFREYARRNIVEDIGEEKILKLSPTSIRRRFDGLSEELDPGFLRDLRKTGNIDDNERLTMSGVRFLKKLAKESD